MVATLLFGCAAPLAYQLKIATPPTTFGPSAVTRLPPGPVCHVAYVDAIANKDANALANSAADDLTRSFDCRKDPTIVGKPGAISLVPGTKT